MINVLSILAILILAVVPAESGERIAARIPVASPPDVTPSASATFRLVAEKSRPKRRKPTTITWYLENTGEQDVWVPVRRNCACTREGYYRIYVRDEHYWEEAVPVGQELPADRSWLFVAPKSRWKILSTRLEKDSRPWTELVVEFVYQVDDQFHIQCIGWSDSNE